MNQGCPKLKRFAFERWKIATWTFARILLADGISFA